MIFRSISILMVLVFLLSVAVQYNDPDPLVWMTIYGVCAVFAGLGAMGKHSALAVPAAVIYWVGMFYWMPHKGVANPMNLITDVKMASLGVEEWREDGGLAICATWLTVQSVMWWLRRPKTAPEPTE